MTTKLRLTDLYNMFMTITDLINYYLSVPRFVQVKSTGALSFVAQPKFYLVSSSPRVRPLRMLSEPARGFSVRTSHTHRVSIPPL
jgi:hypothetical protein